MEPAMLETAMKTLDREHSGYISIKKESLYFVFRIFDHVIYQISDVCIYNIEIF